MALRLAGLFLVFLNIDLTSGLHCMHCEGQENLDECIPSYKCNSYETGCFTQINDFEGKRVIYSRCLRKHLCDMFLNGTKGNWKGMSFWKGTLAYHGCQQCCEGDYCNRHLCLDLLQGPVTGTVVTTKAPLIPSGDGFLCASCSGGNCGRSGSDATVQCPNPFPFCMNTVENDANGNQIVTKACASKIDCEMLWLGTSANQSICNAFDPSKSYLKAFTCHFCCTTNNCNVDIHPHANTLFTGL